MSEREVEKKSEKIDRRHKSSENEERDRNPSLITVVEMISIPTATVTLFLPIESGLVLSTRLYTN